MPHNIILSCCRTVMSCGECGQFFHLVILNMNDYLLLIHTQWIIFINTDTRFIIHLELKIVAKISNEFQ